MKEISHCPECGAELAAGTPKALCPRCALKGLLEPAGDESASAATSGGRDALPRVQADQQVGPGTSKRPAPEGQGWGHPSVRRQFGDYELLEEIARGGMGVVYKARQKSLDRLVAVKFLLFGPHASVEFIKRFRIEASAAAALQHPNIVAIHEVGVHEDEHFLVMDYVDGPNLAKLVRDQPLPPKRASQYLKTIAEAIHYAHERGILHRDLKPSNVLIDSNDQPRVTDFGLAKRLGTDTQPSTDHSQLTVSGQVMGSPGYMPPEQACGVRGKMSRRSDVYSLGAMLYHLLTGRPPFGGGSVPETLRQVETQEPVSPRLLNPDVPFDLETICLKCLEKDPERRYRTAGELSNEVGRFLNDEPIQARPPSRIYRFRKLVRRNKLVFGATAAAVAASFAGTIVSAWQAIRAKHAETLAEQRVIQVAAERDEKDKARQDAEAISSFLTEVFRSPDPTQSKGRTITVAASLDAAAAKLEKDLSLQPARRAKLQAVIGTTYQALGLYREAVALHEKVLAYSRSAFGEGHPDTLRAMNDLAMSWHAVGRRDEALKLLEEVVILDLKLHGPEHLETLRAMNRLAISYDSAGRHVEALKLNEEVLPLRRKLEGPEHPDTLTTMNNLANSYDDAGRLDEAIKLFEEVLPLSRKLLGPEHPDTIRPMNNLAISYHRAGRRGEALKLLEEVVPLHRKVHGPEHPVTLQAMNNLASFYKDAGRREEALKLLEEALPIRRKVLGPENPGTLTAMNNLASLYNDFRRWEEALKLLEETLPLRRKILGLEHPNTLSTMNNLARSYSYAGRREEALALQEDALRLSRKVHGPEHPNTLLAMNNLSVSYGHVGRQEEALKLRQEVLTLRRKVQGPEHPDTLPAMYNLAVSYDATGRREEALQLRDELLMLSRKVLGPEHPETLEAMHSLVVSYDAAERRDEALRLRKEELLLSRNVLGPEHSNTLAAAMGLVRAYKAEQRYAEAEPLCREHLQHQTARYPATNETVVSALSDLAGLLDEWAWSERGAVDKTKAVERAREAERLLRDSLATRTNTLRPESLRLAETKSRLGAALVTIAVVDSLLTAEAQLARFTEAESLLLKGYEAFRQSERAEPRYTREALKRLLLLYEAWGKPEKLSEWRQKLDALKAAKDKSLPAP